MTCALLLTVVVLALQILLLDTRPQLGHRVKTEIPICSSIPQGTFVCFFFIIIIFHVFFLSAVFVFGFLFSFSFDTTDSTANGMENVRERKENDERQKKKKVEEWTNLVACHALYIYPILTLFCG